MDMGEMDIGDVGSMDGMAQSSTMFWGASAWLWCLHPRASRDVLFLCAFCCYGCPWVRRCLGERWLQPWGVARGAGAGCARCCVIAMPVTMGSCSAPWLMNRCN